MVPQAPPLLIKKTQINKNNKMNFNSSSLKKVLLTTLSFTLLVSATFAATIKGTLKDAETGITLEFASIIVKKAGTDTYVAGASSELDGTYVINNIPAGTYDVHFRYTGYDSLIVTNITLTANQVKVLDTSMVAAVITSKGSVIDYEKPAVDDEAGGLVKRQDDTKVSDVITAGELSKTGTSDAKGAAQKIVGATTEGNYMVVRGLGDRYSLTQLNGMTMPSADPYRNSASLDLIPVDMVDNFTTVKTFSPDQPGNFTGGKMDIKTKSIPNKFYMSFGLSTTYNTQSSFNKDFLSDGSRSNTDWLGFDDGLRARPTSFDTYNTYVRNIGNANATSVKARNDANTEERDAIVNTANSLNNSYTQTTRQVPMNHGFDFAIGNSYKFGKDSIYKLNRIGVNFGLNYSRDYTFYQNQEFGVYSISTGGSEDLVANQVFTDTKGVDQTQFGALLNSAVRFKRNFSIHTLSVMGMYNNGSENTAQVYEGFWLEMGGASFNSRSTSFIQRTVANTQVAGEHNFNALGGLKVNWSTGYTKSAQLEPDTRLFAYTYDVGNDGDTLYQLRKSAHDLPSNFFRDLADEQQSAKLDFHLPIFGDTGTHKKDGLKFGMNYSKKTREFNEFRYEMSLSGLQESTAWTSFNEADGDFDAFFAASNAGIVDTTMIGGKPRYVNGNFYSDVTKDQNSYTGIEKILAYYLMADYTVTNWLMFSGGVRVEETLLQTTSKDTNAANGNINRRDFLPALTGIFSLTDSSRIIAAFSKTLARPNMREISPFASVAGIGAPIVLGNGDLDRTLINNYDLRYEKFSKVNRTDVFAVSAYYKNFKNPIIWLLTPTASTAEIRPVNVPTAKVYGLEFELKRSLKPLGNELKNFSFGTNISLIYSRVDKDISELNALQNANRTDIETFRPFQGQSPFIVNFVLAHTNDSANWDNALSFNMWGDRLAFVTGALNPDVYEKSRPSLDFTSRKKINKNFSVSFKVKNIFNMEYRKVFKYKETDNVYQSYRLGRNFSFGLSYNF